MFSGIIAAPGEVLNLCQVEGGKNITVKTPGDFTQNLKVGDSVAINGACQTATLISDNCFTVFASLETINCTNFSLFKVGTELNLEKSLRLNDSVDGHLVTGHIDGIALLNNVQKLGNSYRMSFKVPSDLLNKIAPKGSICLDGVSLTVNEVKGEQISVMVIPHTYQETILHNRKNGDSINIEVDVIARYVVNFLSYNNSNQKEKDNNILSLLKRNGF